MRPADAHGDSRNLVTLDLQGAADAASTSVPQVVGNIARSLALWRGRSAGMSGMAAKELDPETVAAKTLAMQEEKRYTLALGYPVRKADVAIAVDNHRDFVTDPVLEEAAWNFLKQGAKVGLLHARGTEGAGVVVESYIYRGPDWAMKAVDGSEVTIVAGDWLVGTIWDPVAWRAIKTGRINGVSYQGRVNRRTPSAEALAALRS